MQLYTTANTVFRIAASSKSVLTRINTALNIFCNYSWRHRVIWEAVVLLRRIYLLPSSDEKYVYIVGSIYIAYHIFDVTVFTEHPCATPAAVIITQTMCVCWPKHWQPSIWLRFALVLRVSPLSVSRAARSSGFSVHHSPLCPMLCCTNKSKNVIIIGTFLQIKTNVWILLTSATLLGEQRKPQTAISLSKCSIRNARYKTHHSYWI